jgi:hypothetical protein
LGQLGEGLLRVENAVCLHVEKRNYAVELEWAELVVVDCLKISEELLDRHSG